MTQEAAKHTAKQSRSVRYTESQSTVACGAVVMIVTIIEHYVGNSSDANADFVFTKVHVALWHQCRIGVTLKIIKRNTHGKFALMSKLCDARSNKHFQRSRNQSEDAHSVTKTCTREAVTP